LLSADFEVQNQDSPPAPTRRFAVIQGDSSNSNQPIYFAQTYDNEASYICQFAGKIPIVTLIQMSYNKTSLNKIKRNIVFPLVVG